DFIELHPYDAEGPPTWKTRNGKARVLVRGDRIEIKASYVEQRDGVDRVDLDNPWIVIAGTLRPDRTIDAQFTRLATDESPHRLSGRYLTKERLEIWGTQRKTVTITEIVFPHPQNFRFLGFVSRSVRDAK